MRTAPRVKIINHIERRARDAVLDQKFRVGQQVWYLDPERSGYQHAAVITDAGKDPSGKLVYNVRLRLDSGTQARWVYENQIRAR